MVDEVGNADRVASSAVRSAARLFFERAGSSASERGSGLNRAGGVNVGFDANSVANGGGKLRRPMLLGFDAFSRRHSAANGRARFAICAIQIHKKRRQLPAGVDEAHIKPAIFGKLAILK